jgi:four helix bundle protein
MKKELFDTNPILKLSFDFSLLVMEYCENLEEKRKYVISRQLLKSGTSIGANSMEAQNPESKADFIHKMKIAAKEAEETQYWLWLCDYAKNYPDCNILLNKMEEINRIPGSILKTAKRKTPVSYLLSYFIF